MGYEYMLGVFDDIISKYEEESGGGLSIVEFTKGNVGGVKQLDPEYLPISDSFFIVDDSGKLTLDIAAVKKAIEDYVEPPK